MGGVGNVDGLWPVPAPPPPVWQRGGTHWIYERDYGPGRPKTSVWADCDTPEECARGKAKPPPESVREAIPPPVVRAKPAPVSPPPAAAPPPPPVPQVESPAPQPRKEPAQVPAPAPVVETPAPPAPSTPAPAPASKKEEGGCQPPCLVLPASPDGGFPKLPASGGMFDTYNGGGYYVSPQMPQFMGAASQYTGGQVNAQYAAGGGMQYAGAHPVQAPYQAYAAPGGSAPIPIASTEGCVSLLIHFFCTMSSTSPELSHHDRADEGCLCMQQASVWPCLQTEDTDDRIFTHADQRMLMHADESMCVHAPGVSAAVHVRQRF